MPGVTWLLARLARLWRGIPEWAGPYIDYGGRWADVTGGEDE